MADLGMGIVLLALLIVSLLLFAPGAFFKKVPGDADGAKREIVGVKGLLWTILAMLVLNLLVSCNGVNHLDGKMHKKVDGIECGD